MYRLLGVATLQCFRYFPTFPKDPLILKLTVLPQFLIIGFLVDDHLGTYESSQISLFVDIIAVKHWGGGEINFWRSKMVGLFTLDYG